MMLYPKTREEWLELRQRNVSSTESSALFGLNPYTTMYELAVVKKATETPEEYDATERMSWGLRLQRAIAQGIAEDYGVKVRAISGYAVLPDIRMGASFDFEVVGLKEDYAGESKMLRNLYTQHGPGVLEIKNVDAWIFKQDWQETAGENGSGQKAIEAPAHIELQVQHQLHCIEREWAGIGVLVGGNRQLLICRMRDRDVGNALATKVGRFWNGIGQGKMPPVTMPQDAAIIRKVYGYAEPGSVLDCQVEDNAELHQLARNHAESTKWKSEAEKAHKTSGALLMQALGTAEKALFADMTVSAGMVGPSRVEAYDREGYRNLRVYTRAPKK